MDKEYNIWITVVSIKFNRLLMLNFSPKKTVYLLKLERVTFVNQLTFWH